MYSPQGLSIVKGLSGGGGGCYTGGDCTLVETPTEQAAVSQQSWLGILVQNYHKYLVLSRGKEVIVEQTKLLLGIFGCWEGTIYRGTTQRPYTWSAREG